MSIIFFKIVQYKWSYKTDQLWKYATSESNYFLSFMVTLSVGYLV